MSETAVPLEPRRQSALVGHVEAERELAAAARSGRLAHAWLITGARGIGKATLAYRFARWLLAGMPERLDGSLDVDADDRAFRLIAAGSHPDLVTVERATGEGGRLRAEIVIDDVRAAGAFLHLTPAIAPWRAVVVDAADDLNPNAANALLKVLEEPPSRAVLLLVAHAPARLLPTLRSRCLRLDLRPLPEADVVRLIRPYLEDPAEAGPLAALAEGSPGRALAVAAAGGTSLYQEIATIAGGLPSLDDEAVHALADRWSRRGAEETFRVGLELVRTWIERRVRADLAGANAHPGPGSLDGWVEVWEKLGQLARQADGLRLDRKHVVIAAFAALADATRA